MNIGTVDASPKVHKPMSLSGLTAATTSGCLDLIRLKRLKGRSVGSGVSGIWMTSSPGKRGNKTYSID